MRALAMAVTLAAFLPPPVHAQSATSVRYKLDEVQATLAVQGLDGWLLVNNRRANPVAIELVNPTGNPSHEWFYLIPATGKPRALVHESDRESFGNTGAELATYSSRGKLRRALAKLLAGKKRVAAEYAPGSSIAALTRVAPATAKLIERAGVKLVSLTNLVQFTKSLWGPQGRVAHYVAAHHLDALRKQALSHLASELGAGQAVTEGDLQKLILEGYEVRGIAGGAVVAAGPNTADPSYMTDPTTSRDIARGDLLRLTLWAQLDGASRPIFANITWMAYVGDAIPRKFRDAFQLVARARDATVSLIRDRVARRRPIKGNEAARAARTAIADAGFAAAYTHRTGHSLDTSVVGDGANLDDRDVKDTRPLVRGAGFTIEPGIYFKSDFGMKTEINLFIGRDGVEITTPVQQELTAVFVEQVSKAAILVGGRGRRMGGAVKPLIEIDGRRILDRQLDILYGLGFEVALIGNRLEPFESYALTAVADAEGVEGPLAGLIAALEWAHPGDVLIVAGDMPALDAAVIDEFRAAAAENPDVAVIAARAHGTVQPLHAIYRSSFVADWRRLAVTGKHRSPARILDSGVLPVQWIDDRVRQIDASGSAFRNVNLPADLS